jgi:hypothetical protein
LPFFLRTAKADEAKGVRGASTIRPEPHFLSRPDWSFQKLDTRSGYSCWPRRPR